MILFDIRFFWGNFLDLFCEMKSESFKLYKMEEGVDDCRRLDILVLLVTRIFFLYPMVHVE